MTRRPVRTFAIAAITAAAMSACSPTVSPVPEPDMPTAPTAPTAPPEPTAGTPGDKKQKITAAPDEIARALAFLYFADEAYEPTGFVKFLADLDTTDGFKSQYTVTYTPPSGEIGRPSVKVVRRADKKTATLKDISMADPLSVVGDYDKFTLAMAQITATDVKEIRENIPKFVPSEAPPQ